MDRIDRGTPPTIPHHVILQERNCLELTGITEVKRFDELSVCCQTPIGLLLVEGKDLHVQKLDVEGTALSVTGLVDSLTYTDVRKGGLFGRLFR